MASADSGISLEDLSHASLDDLLDISLDDPLDISLDVLFGFSLDALPDACLDDLLDDFTLGVRSGSLLVCCRMPLFIIIHFILKS